VRFRRQQRLNRPSYICPQPHKIKLWGQTDLVDSSPDAVARAWVSAQDWIRFLGTAESKTLDVKSGPYRLDDPGSAAELVKDVAAFANSDGGLILVGFTTKLIDGREFIDELRPVPARLVDTDRYRKIIRERTVPHVRGLSVQFYPGEDEHGVLVIDIPRQPESAKPFVVPGPDGRGAPTVVGAPIRDADATHWLSRSELQRLLSAGWNATNTSRADLIRGVGEAAATATAPFRDPTIAKPQQLDLTVIAEPAALEVMPDFMPAIERWATRRQRVLRSARYGRRAGVPPGSLEEKILKDPFSRIGPPTIGLTPDQRTEEQYIKQIDTYLTKAQTSLADRAVWHLYRHAPAQLRLRVVNPTDTGFKAVRLDVHIPGEVKAVPASVIDLADGDLPALPQAPPPLGTPIDTFQAATDKLANTRWLSSGAMSTDRFRYGKGPAFTVADTGSVTIAYRDFDLRPGAELALDPVPLWVREAPGVTLEATWQATGDGVRGRLTGKIGIIITASTLDVDHLDRDPD
jgi:hypothetical protein